MRYVPVCCFGCAVVLSLASCTPPEAGQVLWYKKPAASWTEALPVGNGRLGAMVFGGIDEELLELNEDTLYAGAPSACGKARIREHVDRVFGMIQAGRYAEADRFVTEHMLGRNHQTYTTLGKLRLLFQHRGGGEVEEYRRQLDLSRAVVSCRYRSGGARYSREVFATAPDDVIVIRLSCTRAASISFTAWFETPHRHAKMAPAGGDGLALSAKLPMHACNRTIGQIRNMGDAGKYPWLFDEDGTLLADAGDEDRVVYAAHPQGRGMDFRVALRALVDGGRVSSGADGLIVSDADRVTLVLAADSTFAGFDTPPDRGGVDPAEMCARRLARAAKLGYGRLYRRHRDDYRRLYGRVKLDLGGTDGKEVDTAKAIDDFATTDDPDLVERYFRYGRYLMIASSRPGTQPANLQGIWNDEVHAPWNGGYTTNINAEMNYWPAEVGNLPECHLPLLKLTEECAVNGRMTAEKSYGCPGWVCHHNVSLWRVTDPIDRQARFSFWPMAGGWLCRHLWEHYARGGDEDYLRQRAYPLMADACRFYLAWLREDADGHLVTPISTSPENRFKTDAGVTAAVSMASTMDMSIIRDLFANTIDAAQILDIDETFRKQLEHTIPRLYPFKIGRHGQLQEWYRDWDRTDDHHRHLSGLYCVYPARLVTPGDTPALAAAAAKSLQMRGPGSVGFSRAWAACIWARLGFPERAYDRIRAMLADGSSPNLFTQCYAGKPRPFSIEANFGGAAAIAEMLLQSRLSVEEGEVTGTVRLLPALPKAWPQGSVAGLVAEGGFVVAMDWKDGAPTKASIRSRVGNRCVLFAGLPVVIRSEGREIETERAGGGLAFPTAAEKVYDVVVKQKDGKKKNAEKNKKKNTDNKQ